MKFSQLAKYLQKLEETSKRLEITTILSDLIKDLDSSEIDKALYLSRGYLDAEFRTEKFNIAEKMMVKILARTYMVEESEIKKIYSELGDLGSVAESLTKETKFNLELTEVHEKLLQIAQVEGNGSQERKIHLTSELLRTMDPTSAKFATRTILGTTRLGFTELTIIDGLVEFLIGKKDKEIKKQIEDKYRVHPDIGLIAKIIKEKGLKGLDKVDLEPGVPIHAQKPQRLGSPAEIVEKMKKVWAEYKFDGTRVQLHLDRGKQMEVASFEQQSFFEVKKDMTFIRTFTRNLEETTHQFPDIIEAANTQIKAESVILDGEAIGYDRETGKFLPFQETMQRKRKHGVSDMAKSIPLKYLVFDLLYLNGKSLINEPLTKRRKLLDSIIKKGEVIVVDDHLETTETKILAAYSKEALDKGLEGIIAKNPDAGYKAGARGFEWVKLKKLEDQILNDTVDCVVLGYYFGKGVRANFGIGGFLAGIYDEKDNKIKTVTKVGTGLKDDDWKYLKKEADKISTPEKPKNLISEKKFDCDVWVKPEMVVEIAADELSKSKEHSVGYALRFPRLIKFRKDRKATDTTTPKEIIDMYNKQKK